MFDVEISGYEETIDMLKKMEKGLTEEGLNEYCDMVKTEARNKCGLADAQITLQAKKVDKDITIDFQLKDRSKLDCFKESIRSKFPSMPVTTKALFEQLIVAIDKKYPKS